MYSICMLTPPGERGSHKQDWNAHAFDELTVVSLTSFE